MNIYITPEQYDIAAKNGIPRERVNGRVRKEKWPIERAITEPIRNYDSKWVRQAEENGIPAGLFYKRVSLGWSKERASTQKIRRKRDKVEYALYKGDELLFVGTAIECAAFLDVRVSTIHKYASEERLSRIDQGKSMYAVAIEG
ncbi:hypothetical protein [Ornithinibacillus sp. JPR2-1]|uniref:hypothetical protein n=1 Tax=Ornithinibacillus sp. JPR2-1 TaxID=2094019 RepID=UPI0031DA10CE